MDNTINERAENAHKQWRGKIEIAVRSQVSDAQALSLAYTPGVAEPCRRIHADKALVYDYTRKWNLVAVVTDGTAVLGLGDIGPEAGMPVMEGKCALFKSFADVDAFPICLNAKSTDEIVAAVLAIAPTFGGINLEDIAAPRCFEVEERLKRELDIPVFHDDQHGTAVVILAALINALKVSSRTATETSIVINGAGSAGIACAKLLLEYGFRDILLCDKQGALYEGLDGMNDAQALLAQKTNLYKERGTLKDVIKNKDVFIGVSAPGMMTRDMVASMHADPIIFAMANPEPEIYPNEAMAGGARIVGTGRSDFNNQINNVLAFPGIFRGALDARATQINEEMKLAAAHAIAGLVSDDALTADALLPKAFDPRVSGAVARAVIKAARATGCARVLE